VFNTLVAKRTFAHLLFQRIPALLTLRKSALSSVVDEQGDE